MNLASDHRIDLRCIRWRQMLKILLSKYFSMLYKVKVKIICSILLKMPSCWRTSEARVIFRWFLLWNRNSNIRLWWRKLILGKDLRIWALKFWAETRDLWVSLFIFQIVKIRSNLGKSSKRTSNLWKSSPTPKSTNSRFLTCRLRSKEDNQPINHLMARSFHQRPNHSVSTNITNMQATSPLRTNWQVFSKPSATTLTCKTLWNRKASPSKINRDLSSWNSTFMEFLLMQKT